MPELDLNAIMHVLLVTCKIAGVVGAFFGLSERLHEKEKPTRWKRFAPATFLLFAISAELFDAKLKQSEDVKQETVNKRQEAVNDQLLHPIRSVTAYLELSIPEAVLKAKSKDYYDRVHGLMHSDVAHDIGYVEVYPNYDGYPSVKDENILLALQAYYEESLRFSPTETPGAKSKTKNKKKENSTYDVWMELQPGADYVYDWGQTDATYVPKFPPKGRRYMLNNEGLTFMDVPATLDLNGIASPRGVRTISDFKGRSLVLTVCPKLENDSEFEERAATLSELIYMRNLSLTIDGLGTFSSKDSASHFDRDLWGSCVRFKYQFPNDPDKLTDLFK